MVKMGSVKQEVVPDHSDTLSSFSPLCCTRCRSKGKWVVFVEFAGICILITFTLWWILSWCLWPLSRWLTKSLDEEVVRTPMASCTPDSYSKHVQLQIKNPTHTWLQSKDKLLAFRHLGLKSYTTAEVQHTRHQVKCPPGTKSNAHPTQEKVNALDSEPNKHTPDWENAQLITQNQHTWWNKN